MPDALLTTTDARASALLARRPVHLENSSPQSLMWREYNAIATAFIQISY
jgi:hypothetical protein